jgi:hypothetical protein
VVSSGKEGKKAFDALSYTVVATEGGSYDPVSNGCIVRILLVASIVTRSNLDMFMEYVGRSSKK